ncbi:putative fibrinogen-like protein A-like [Apostichopus japonicus]|uniref:Putative fibrinogen-like protein A-like n=1 Tax=Stichopus japonicus TaxID=307972 RepID=A0A2G8LHB7_STIJA|nr:putative fibrinogen-like protein A-like [Apostichopus japonicus]
MIKILRYADETQLLLDGTKDSLQEALHIFNIFNVVSCLFINVEKSSLFPLGRPPDTCIKVLESLTCLIHFGRKFRQDKTGLYVNDVNANLVEYGIPSDNCCFVHNRPKYPRDCHEAVSQYPSIQNTSFVSLIKPDGYEEPFDVFCDKDTAGGSTWTVIQRRLGETIIFNRSWSDYKHGFGFPGREFWIGNEKLAHLTNQKRYELRMEFENPAGQSYYVTYEYFRIDDELGNYAISSLGNFGGNADPKSYKGCFKEGLSMLYTLTKCPYRATCLSECHLLLETFRDCELLPAYITWKSSKSDE